MLGSLQSNKGSSHQQALKDILNLNHELCQLSDAIDWKFIEDKLAIYYSSTGRPSHSIRLMASLLILKSVRNLSDEKLVNKQWRENIYYQYFSGYQYHSLEKPCTSSQLVHFRKRIGEEGVEVILEASIRVHGSPKLDKKEQVVYADTTVQKKNITFPTDSKLQKKIIDNCGKIAKQAGVQLKNTFKKSL